MIYPTKIGRVIKRMLCITSGLCLLGCNSANNQGLIEEEIGEFTTSAESRSEEIRDSPLSPQESERNSSVEQEASILVTEAARLSPHKIEALMSLAREAKRQEPERDFKILVPTYVPPGFEVDSVELKAKPVRFSIPFYEIKYRNSIDGTCFVVGANSGGWGDGVSEHESIEVFSQALGLLVLQISSFDLESSSEIISFRDILIRNGRRYYFRSPFTRLDAPDACRSISAKEAVQVVESLHYLDSPGTKARPLEEIRADGDRLLSKFNFPLDTCGDSPSREDDRWHPVFMDGVSLAEAQEFCKDAFDRGGQEESFRKVQIGSFTSYERALDLAKAVGGRVGEPDE
jgi:hypothetical protein